MILTLLRYEMKKILGGKFFWIALCLMLAVNALMTCGLRQWTEWKDTMNSLGLDAGKSFQDYRKDNITHLALTKDQYSIFEKSSKEELVAFEAAMIEKYGDGVFDPYAEHPIEMRNLPGYFGEQWSDEILVSIYQNLQSWNRANSDAFHSVVESAKIHAQKAEAEGDHYSVKRNEQIIHLYSKYRGEITYPVQGWDTFLFDTPTMLLVFLMVWLSTAGAFTSEREDQTILILNTAKNGKGKTLAAKYLAGAVIAAWLTMLFQLFSLGGTWYHDGLMGVTQPVSTIDELLLFPYPIPVWQYLFLTLMCQTFTSVLLSVFLNAISALSRSSTISYVVGAVFLGCCILLNQCFSSTMVFSGPLALSLPLPFFDAFDTTNILGFPILRAIVYGILWSLVSAAMILLSCKVYHKKEKVI